MSSYPYVGLAEAAEILGTTKQTVRNWATAGRITVSYDADVLANMNAHKAGRPHEYFYFRDQLEAVRRERDADIIEPGPDYIRIDKAAKALCITSRTLNRIRERNSIPEFVGSDTHIYLRLRDVANLRPGIDYRTTVHPDQLETAAQNYGLAEIRNQTP